MKRVLVTAGQVYSSLDDNKVVGNRVRGIWAVRFAEYLAEHGHDVLLLVPDVNTPKYTPMPGLKCITHKGFQDYLERCQGLAQDVDSTILAAAVVNWIPADPIKGKMATKGYKPNDIIQIPFRLAPYVIDEMKKANPRLCLIGCKMLIDAPESELIDAAYELLLRAKCNAVVANDMGHGLRRKLVVHQDRTIVEFNDDWDAFNACLLAHIEDQHYETSWGRRDGTTNDLFDRIVAKYQGRFTVRQAGSDRVFGSVLVPLGNWTNGDEVVGLVSPREKGQVFSSRDAAEVRIFGKTVHAVGPNKASLNAPLLMAVLGKYPHATAVLHLHEQLPGVPTVPYAPPGTVRDNNREIPGPVFNIEGHGFIACLDSDLEILEPMWEPLAQSDIRRVR